MKIKIYGYGWVGKGMHTLFPDALIHDPFVGLEDNNIADVAFICVPTPLQEDGSLDCSIVEDVIKSCKEELIIVRSTVNPGFCDAMAEQYSKDIVFQPEYLGETVNHPLTNQKDRPFIVIGGHSKALRQVISLYQTVYNANVTIRQLTRYEAEVVKLTENRAIAFKMMQCQELYDACEAAGIDYYKIRDAVYSDDPRFNLWWTFVYPEKRGFNSSKCLVKDVPAWCAWAESLGIAPVLTNSLVIKSNEYETISRNSGI